MLTVALGDLVGLDIVRLFSPFGQCIVNRFANLLGVDALFLDLVLEFSNAIGYKVIMSVRLNGEEAGDELDMMFWK